jgi:hypothetical protein
LEPTAGIFTRSKSAETITPITITHVEPIKRAASSEALRLPTSSEWDEADILMAAAINKRAFSAMDRTVGQRNVFTDPDGIKRAKQDTNASPYTRVLCRFKDGVNEVSMQNVQSYALFFNVVYS